LKLHRRWIPCAAGVMLAGFCCGCESGAGPRSIDNPDSGQKIEAIVASEAGQIPQLIRELENDDPAVRFYAIGKLERLTGQTFGYQYYVDEEKRAPAVMQWKAWLKGWEAGKQGPEPK
jgi:hypothetical protein